MQLPYIGKQLAILVAAASLCACDPVRTLVLASVLPQPCVTGQVNELQVRGLGDFPPSSGVVGSLDSVLDLPRGTRVVSIAGSAPEGLVAFGQTAPMELSDSWSDPRHVIAIAYGPPDSFCTTANLLYPRTGHHATLLQDGSVLISGGVDGEGFPVTTLERYLPTGDATSQIARFVSVGSTGQPAILSTRAVLGHQATRLDDGRVLVTGGSPSLMGVASGPAFEGAQFLSADGSIEGTTRVLEGGPRASHADLLLPDGRVLIAGGCAGLDNGVCPDANLLSSVEIYDPATDQFSLNVPLITARSGHHASLRDDGLVVIVGGQGVGGVALAPELYDPSESRGSTISGPAGDAVLTESGLLISLNDAAGPSARTTAWSGRDEAPVVLSQLPSAVEAGTLTTLEDDSVLVAGGWDDVSLAQTSVVLAPGHSATTLSGFVGRGHSATLLFDGTVLLAGGFDGTGAVSARGALFLRSLTGSFDTPATFGFDAPSEISPSRPDRVVIANGMLTLDAVLGSRSPDVFALVSGPQLAGPSGAGFDVTALVGQTGAAEAAILFGDPGQGDYVAAAFKVGAPPRLLRVQRDRPGLLDVEEIGGCTSVALTANELPDASLSTFVLSARRAQIVLRSAQRTLLSCAPDASIIPERGRIALGVISGTVNFDNVQLER